ncbi:hypothetical protein [Streptomyces chrestomyceticus]|uniref:hypothetical protein n=1 Tax=Streptomyces chrestomyceticus TaxID=68185 RepID=UPI0019CFB515|nr:hypothetical protein [Streptomyces chrestomyceticus]
MTLTRRTLSAASPQGPLTGRLLRTVGSAAALSAALISVMFGVSPAAADTNAAPGAPTGATGTVLSSKGSDGHWYASQTPTLRAAVPDADSPVLRLDFELSKRSDFEGGGVVWTDSLDDVPAGQSANIVVPAGTLQDGGRYRWRVRGFDGTSYGAWSIGYELTIDASAPAAPSVSCPGYPANVWTPRISGGTPCTFDTASGDGVGYFWGLDDPDPTKLVKDPAGEGGNPLSATVVPDYGRHTLFVAAVDRGGNISTVTEYPFNVGYGSLNSPADGESIAKAADGGAATSTVTLASEAPSDKYGVTYRYKAVDTTAWTAVPVGDVSTGTGSSPAAWPLKRTDPSTPFASLVWNAAKTIKDAGLASTEFQVVACFTDKVAGNEQCSSMSTITVKDPTLPEDSDWSPLPAETCQELKASGAGDFDEDCGIGSVVSAGSELDASQAIPDGRVAAAAASRWKYRDVSAYLCAFKSKAQWGKPSGLKCAAANAQLKGTFKYNGSRVYAHWYGCADNDTKGLRVNISWCGKWNNGASSHADSRSNFMNIGMNGTCTLLGIKKMNFWVRIDAWPNGRVSLRNGR